MSDFKDLLDKTLDNINENHYKETQKEYTLDCGHVVKGYTKSLIISGKKAGLPLYTSVTVCPSCAYVLYDKEDPDHYIVKNIVKKRKSK